MNNSMLSSEEKRNLLLVLLVINLFYFPSLFFGYFYDDFWILKQSLTQAHPLHYARPVWHITTVFFALIDDGAFFQRIISLACFNGVAIAAYFLLRNYRYSTLLLLVVLSHPGLVYPVTWISQRSDLFWIFFVVMALMAQRGKAIASWTVLSMLSKTPFILHGIVFAARLFRQGDRLHGILIFVSFLLLVGTSYLLSFPYSNTEFQGATGGTHELKAVADSSLKLMFVVAVTGAAKIIESIVIMFVPFPAVYGTGIFGYVISLAYLSVWTVILWYTLLKDRTNVNWLWVQIGLAAAAAFFLVAQLRAVAPSCFFLLLGILTGILAFRFARLILVFLLVLNVMSSIAMYQASNTDCYDIDQENAAQTCREPSDLPYYQWQINRNKIVHDLANALKRIL